MKKAPRVTKTTSRKSSSSVHTAATKGGKRTPAPRPTTNQNRRSASARPAAKTQSSRTAARRSEQAAKQSAPRAKSQARRQTAETRSASGIAQKSGVTRSASRPRRSPDRAGSSGVAASATAENSKKSNNKRVAAIVAIVLAVVIAAGAVVGVILYVRHKKGGGAAFPPEKGLQNISYTETLDYVANPDQGFYRTAFLKLDKNGAASKSTPTYGETQLYHLRVDISAFSSAAGGEDADITDPALDALEEVLMFYESRGNSYIVRFAYDAGFGGHSNYEPTIEVMVGHVRALSAVLNRHLLALTAIEVGMVGPWGEMHTSTAANSDNIKKLTQAFLDNVEGVPVLVRTPKMIYDFLGITVGDLDSYVVPENTCAYRLGMFNDGYLGSDSDLGTYTNRAKETAWLGGGQTSHLPYGGEVTVPDSSLHDIDKCTGEMFLMHLSYLNYEWNNTVVQNKWANSEYTKAAGSDSRYYGQSAYTYIRNRLGYRLVVRKSVFDQIDGKLDIKLDVENVGFGNLNRVKSAEIVFVNADGEEVLRVAAGEYSGESEFRAQTPLPEEEGSYDVYLALHAGADNDRAYPVALSNVDMYDAELKANKIGTCVIAPVEQEAE